jgi:hypothetical protein
MDAQATVVAGCVAGRSVPDGERWRARSVWYKAREPERAAPGCSSPCGKALGLLQDDDKVATMRVEHSGA